MNTDAGRVYVALEHFSSHLYPRALEIEKQLESGEPITTEQLAHVLQVLEDIKLLWPLIERHPEHREIAGRVVATYAGIARRALENERASNGQRVNP